MIKVMECMDNAHTGKVGALKVTATGEESAVVSELLHEHRMELWVNEQLVAKLVCTPENLDAYVVGRLITEGLIRTTAEIEMLHISENGKVAKVTLTSLEELAAGTAEEPTSVLGNQVLLRPLELGGVEPLSKVAWEKEWIYNIVDVFSKDSKLHKSTGGTHSCVLAVGGEIVYVVEDLGRHNAMDKAIGYAALNEIAPENCILFTTGRVPVDMVSKVIQARIPVLVSKSIPTMDAVEMAREYGLTLICRAWPDGFEVYG